MPLCPLGRLTSSYVWLALLVTNDHISVPGVPWQCSVHGDTNGIFLCCLLDCGSCMLTRQSFFYFSEIQILSLYFHFVFIFCYYWISGSHSLKMSDWKKNECKLLKMGVMDRVVLLIMGSPYRYLVCCFARKHLSIRSQDLWNDIFVK